MNNVPMPWWQSRTIWSALVVIVCQILRLADVIDLDDVLQQQIVDAILAAISFGAGIAAVGFRMTATRTII